MRAIIEQSLIRAAPLIFVVLWSTGFIGAKYGLPYAEPFIFLSIRFTITIVLLALIVLTFVKPRLDRRTIFHSLVSGFLIHGIYLGGTFYAIHVGMSAGISALTVSIQPLLTVFIAAILLKESVSAKQFGVLIVAFIGVSLVMSPNWLGGKPVEGISFENLIASGLAVLGISLGTVYQKKYLVGVELRVCALFQYIGAVVPLFILSNLVEHQNIQWTADFYFALVWLVVVLSLGAVGLLMFLIRRESAVSVASLFYLVPVSTAIIAYFMFDEKLQWVQVVGAAFVVCAIAYGARLARKS